MLLNYYFKVLFYSLLLFFVADLENYFRRRRRDPTILKEERKAAKMQHAPGGQPLLDRGEGEQGARTRQRGQQTHSRPREWAAESRMLE